MKPEIHVGKNVHNPNFDVQLTDVEGKTLGLILCNTKGASDRRGIMQSSMPRTAMQMSAGGNSYDDMEMPYTVEVQTSMIGGRGMDDFVKDKTRYADAFRMDTSSVNPILGPSVIQQNGFKETALRFDVPEYGWQTWMTGDPDTDPTKSSMYMSLYVTGTKTFTGMTVYIKGWTGAITIYYGIGALLNDHEYSLPYSKTVYGNGIDQWVNLPFPAVTITNAAVTWSFGCDQRFYVLAALAPGVSTYQVWPGPAFSPFWTVGHSFMNGLLYEADCEYKFFEYKRALYMIKNGKDGNSGAIYRNGYRGVAIANTGEHGNLVSSLSVGTNTLKGAVAQISDGPGEQERQNWRDIIGNLNTRIQVSSPWNIEHTATTEYVILGTNVWTQVFTNTKPVTDVLIVGDYYIVAFGSESNLLFIKESNAAGTWTQTTYWQAGSQFAAGGVPDRYHFLELTQDVKGRIQIWAANAETCQVTYSLVPAFGSNLVFDIWPDERELFGTQLLPNSTIGRLAADLGAVPAGTEYNSTRTQLQRKVADAERERDKLLKYIQAGDTSSRITNMVIYGAPGIPYIMKETEIGSIDQNVYAKIPIAELNSVRSERNGTAAMAYGVYLYFNLEGGWIERYYDQRMDDVSPNQNEGLPKERQGNISKLMPYAGRWYASVDAGPAGISSVLVNNELGWHEIYRSDQVGKSITDIYVQAIPGISNPDLLWIAEGTDIIAIPIAISPIKQEKYKYYGVGLPKDKCSSIETPWIDMNYKDVNKYFHSINLFVDVPNRPVLTGSEYRTYVWYKTDTTDPAKWIYLGYGTALPGEQEFPILLDGDYKAWGKQIKFKIAMQSNNELYTPRLKAWVCNAVVRFEVKKSWQLTFQLQPDKDLLGSKIIMDPNEIYEQIDTWCNSKWHATPLVMRTNDALSDGVRVFVDPLSLMKTSVELALNDKGSKKQHIYMAGMLVFEV